MIARTRIAGSDQPKPESHLVLVFDPDGITVNGKPHNPPDPNGISGGAAFRNINGTLMLSAIMTEHRKSSRVMIATRITEFVAFAQDVIDLERAQAG